jgi:UDP-N-acetylmuramyl pentapeptide phosphotransferase/UDP-N-acetylglucosamine-1-phosphate transferase
MNALLPYIVVFSAAAAASIVLTPIVILLARRWKLYDPREARKVHRAPTPRVGGVAIVLAMLGASLGAMAFDERLGSIFAGMRHQLIVLFVSSTFIFIIGVLDDVMGLRAVYKLAAQLLAAVGVCALGVRIGFIPQLGYLGWFDWPVTIIWIVTITNAVNLIDGLDGLAAGIAAATCAVIAVFNFYTGYVAMGVLMLALLGSLLGFLLFNFNPARVFMGDSGSMFLGFFLATASIVSATKVATVMGLVITALALGLPLFDMMLSVLRRLLERRSIFAADRGHIHHRLLDSGLKHPQAVVVIYLVTLLAAGAGLVLMFWRGEGEIIVVLITLVMLTVVFRLAGMIRFREMFSQVRDNLSRQRTIRRERQQFESMRNRLRAAWTFDQWWRAVRRMARRMGFAQICIVFRSATGDDEETLTYRRPPVGDGDVPQMHLSIPVPGRTGGRLLRVEIDVPVDESLETIGRRVSLFGRLLDEHAIRDEPAAEDAASSAQS